MKPTEQNGQADAGVLRWTGKLLNAEDLRRHLTGQREVIVQRRAIVTPLAVDELKARNVRLVRDDTEPTVQGEDDCGILGLGYAQEKPDAIVASVIASLRRDGFSLLEVRGTGGFPSSWAKELAESVVKGACRILVLFCSDPGLVCCVANKLSGIRAVAVTSALQTVRASNSLGANVFVVEMPGRTFFEARQILLNVCKATAATCPAEVADILQELDSHAHR